MSAGLWFTVGRHDAKQFTDADATQVATKLFDSANGGDRGTTVGLIVPGEPGTQAYVDRV